MDRFDKPRAEWLADFLARRMAGREWDWSRDLALLIDPVPKPYIGRSTTVSTVADSKIVFRRENLPYFKDKQQFPAFRLVAEGIIVDAGYQKDGTWLPLTEEIGRVL